MTKQGARQAEVNIGMIGHVDHGKTSLTKALTGKWTDTHSEELKKGISIRLGYADAVFRKCLKMKGAEAYTTQESCPDGGKSEVLRKVSFVDAPGHETLMTTMLSGAALMQGAVLVISANEPCPQPRTAEHLMALSISGTKKIVVAQNKVDLVTREKALENYKQIRSFLKEYGYEDAPVVPTAANSGVNVDCLIEAMEETIPTPKGSGGGALRMCVARSFDVNKPGTKPRDLCGGVVGGSVLQGKLKKGQRIVLGPGLDGKPVETTVLFIKVEEGELAEAGPGGLIAIETTLDPAITRNDQLRGQVVAEPGKLPASMTNLELEVHPLERLVGEKAAPVGVNDTLVLTIGTMTTVGTVTGKGRGGCFNVELKMPVVAEKGERIAVSKMEKQRWRLMAYGVVR